MINLKKILLIGLLFLTGCSVNYNLEFKDETLNENIEFFDITSTELETLKKDTKYAIFNVSEQIPYNAVYEESNDLKASYNYTYSIDNFNKSLYFNDCFDAVNFVKNEENYILSTSKGFKCLSLDYYFADKISIKLSTNHEVIENNADYINGDKYIWNIDENNAEQTQIYVKFGEVKKLNSLEKGKNFIMSNFLIFCVYGGLLLIIFIIVISILIIGKKNNDI